MIPVLDEADAEIERAGAFVIRGDVEPKAMWLWASEHSRSNEAHQLSPEPPARISHGDAPQQHVPHRVVEMLNDGEALRLSYGLANEVGVRRTLHLGVMLCLLPLPEDGHVLRQALAQVQTSERVTQKPTRQCRPQTYTCCFPPLL